MVGFPSLGRARDQTPDEIIDGGPYVPTPDSVVARMLDLAGVGRGDILFDLGSGDGRLVIEAARRGARGVGIERNGDLVERSRMAAAAVGVADQVRFTRGDIFEADLRGATVVTLYLLPRLLEALAPKLQAELAPGSRVVAHDYPLPAWTAERTLAFDVPEKAAMMLPPQTELFLYRVQPTGGRDATFR